MTTPVATARSVEAIRADFPALTRHHGGHPIAFFDGPGGTQVPERVVEAMADYLRFHNANTHWEYPTSHETDAMIASAREAVAAFLNCSAAEVVFGPNMTTLTFHLARGLGRRLSAGDEIVVTELDHHANIAPWETLAAERGVRLRRIPFRTADGTLDLEELIGAMGPATRVVAVGWASNALGTITDVGAVCRAARERGILTFVDAVHSAPHVLPDVGAIGCDFLACSPYKFYGPHAGVLFGRRSLLDDVPVPRLAPAPAEAPERLETGTQSHEAIAGTLAAVGFLAGIGTGGSARESLVSAYGALHQRGIELFRRLWDGLAELPRVRRFGVGPDQPRTPTAAFVVDGLASSEVARRLAARGVFVSHGDFYAATVVERLALGTEGLVRAGAACYTSMAEVERLLDGVRELTG